MPGWHEQVKDLVAAKRLVLLGITQEQHADRCRLFAQWKKFEFPILHDPINWMGSLAVPIVIAIDEHGVVRAKGPKPTWVRDEFVSTSYPAQSPAAVVRVPNLEQLQRVAKQQPSAAAFRALGDAAMLWTHDVSAAVDAYNAALQREPSAPNHFRLGVALRRRHDSRFRRNDDFPQAVGHWTRALRMEPNQYIWRRRIQQYGPRLDKPYPFYDWVDAATEEIRARGETPIPVEVPLSGAEVATPTKKFIEQGEQESPDPEGKITRDEQHFVRLNVAVVPAEIAPGENIRLHLEFQLTDRALWNNETEPLQVWVARQPGWKPERSLLQWTNAPATAESSEVRRIEVEFQSSETARDASLDGYALYFVCDKTTGVCLFRRQDFSFHANVEPKATD